MKNFQGARLAITYACLKKCSAVYVFRKNAQHRPDVSVLSASGALIAGLHFSASLICGNNNPGAGNGAAG
jgi:hypothetical protein